jgi:crotonobetainyl-CoA:carnitine CoA-transferase CaiB-like acyl-CoA transferase
MKLSETPITYEEGPPLLGEHTEAVLRSVLGLGDDDLERLRAERAI